MSPAVAPALTESATDLLYDLLVATDEFLTVEQARQRLGRRLKLTQDKTDPVNTVVTMYGHPQGVVVSVEWYQRARAALGEPVSWQFAPPPKGNQSTHGEAGE